MGETDRKKREKPLLASYFVFDLPSHVFPSPVNPGWHSHWKDPSTLVQMPFEEQSWVCVVHSSISGNKWKLHDIYHYGFFYLFIFFRYVWYSQMLDNTFFLPYLWIVIFNPYFTLSIIAGMRTENIYMKTSLLCVYVFCWITCSKKLAVIHGWLKWTPIKVIVVILKSSLLVWLFFSWLCCTFVDIYGWSQRQTMRSRHWFLFPELFIN